MRDRRYLAHILSKGLFALLIGVCLPSNLLAAPRGGYYDHDLATTLRELRDTVDALRHEISNHETELRMFEERFNTQDATLSSLRQQMLDATQVNKELVRSSVSSTENKMSSLETANKGLIADMQQLKSHANETSSALADLKKTLQQQSRNVDHLQGAMRTLTEALQVGDGGTKELASTVDSDGGKWYTIKPGDSLEKIARTYGTTVQALKTLNNLTQDRIRVGQKLQIPSTEP